MSEEKKEVKKESKSNKLAVVLIRGFIGMSQEVKDTLQMLRIRRKHTCVVIEDTESNRGMVKKAKDYVTYGEINETTLKELVSKRGKENPQKEKHTKPFFSLAPPRGGFERGGIKKSFKDGGALGYRGKEINDLIKRMI